MPNNNQAEFPEWARNLVATLIILVIVLYALFSVAFPIFFSAIDDIRLALTLIMFVWILNWMRKLLGSARLALLFALVISYLVFFKHPSLLFLIFGMLFLLYGFKPFFDKLTEGKKPPHIEAIEAYKGILEKAKTVNVTIVAPNQGPAAAIAQMPSGEEEKKEGGGQS